MKKRRSRGLGHASKKHDLYAENALDASERAAGAANKFAREGDCKRAMEEAVYAAYLRGAAEAHHQSSAPARLKERPHPTRFSRGGPGIAQEAVGYALSRCSSFSRGPWPKG